MSEEGASHPLLEQRAVIALALLTLPAIGVALMFAQDHLVFWLGDAISALGFGLTVWLYWDEFIKIRLRLRDGSSIQKPLWIGMIILTVDVVTPVIVGVRVYDPPLPSSLENLSLLSEDDLKNRAGELVKQLREFQSDIAAQDQEAYQEEFYRDISRPKNLPKAKQIELFREDVKRTENRSMKHAGEYRRGLFPRAISLIVEMKAREMGTSPAPSSDAEPALHGMLAGPEPLYALADYVATLASKLP